VRSLALAFALQTAPPVDVTWRGDEACPVERFNAKLAAYLAGASEQRPVRVVIDVHQDRRWTADLALTSSDGRSDRHLAGNSCAEVADAAAFVTAVVVDPGVLARPPPADLVDPAPAPEPAAIFVPPPDVAPGPPPPDPPVSAPPPLERPAPTSTPRPKRRLGGFVRLGGGLEALGLPRVAPTANLTAGLLGRRWRVELGAMYRAPTDAPNPVVPAIGARIRLWAVAARGCGVLRPWVLELPLCAGLEAGQAIGRGYGYTGLTERLPWLAALVGPALAWAPRRWIAVWLGVELGIPVIGGRFASCETEACEPTEALPEPVHFTIPRYSIRAGLGLELRIF